MTVGMAFDYFAKENIDFAVIETGLGGRLDSTNLCKPVISIITNIGIDHTAFLGNTLKKNSQKKKAGIIKSGIPVVIGKHQEEIDDIFEASCSKLKSPLFFAEDDMEVKLLQSDEKDIQTMDVWYKKPKYNTTPKNTTFVREFNSKKKNICTALRSIELLKENNIISVSNTEICDGVENIISRTGFYGRWQSLSTNPLTICDTGHNIDGILAIVLQLAEQKFEQLHFVLGMVSDKDISEILNILPNHATYYFCKPDIPRGLDAEKLAQQGLEHGLIGKNI